MNVCVFVLSCLFVRVGFSPFRHVCLCLSMLNQQMPPRRETHNNNNEDNNGNDNNGMQQVLTQLMQVMTQFLANNNNNNPPPPPPPLVDMLTRFLRLRPATFTSASEPVVADDWLRSVNKNLVTIGCTDA